MVKLRLAVAVLATVLLAGCGLNPGRIALQDQCDGWHQITPTSHDVDVISDQLATGVLSHDEHGAAVCGWKPPTKEKTKK